MDDDLKTIGVGGWREGEVDLTWSMKTNKRFSCLNSFVFLCEHPFI